MLQQNILSILATFLIKMLKLILGRQDGSAGKEKNFPPHLIETEFWSLGNLRDGGREPIQQVVHIHCIARAHLPPPYTYKKRITSF